MAPNSWGCTETCQYPKWDDISQHLDSGWLEARSSCSSFQFGDIRARWFRDVAWKQPQEHRIRERVQTSFKMGTSELEHCREKTQKLHPLASIPWEHLHSPRFSSAQSLSRVYLRPHGLQHARLPYLSPTPVTCSNSCPLSRWCHPTISSSVIPFSSCLQSFPTSGSFPMSQFFASGGQSIRVSASASVVPMDIQDWFPLGWTGWLSLQSKGLSRVFSNTIVQKHQFFGT